MVIILIVMIIIKNNAKTKKQNRPRGLRTMCPCRNSISPRSVCNACIIFIRPSATDLHYYLWMWFESSRPPPPSTAVASFHALCQMSVLRSVGAFTRTHFLCHVVVAGKFFFGFSKRFRNVIRSNCVILTCTLRYTTHLYGSPFAYPYVTRLRSVVRFFNRSPPPPKDSWIFVYEIRWFFRRFTLLSDPKRSRTTSHRRSKTVKKKTTNNNNNNIIYITMFWTRKLLSVVFCCPNSMLTVYCTTRNSCTYER